MNPIVYCSKCNASFHKYCYGIEKIPENDFYCDTCYEDYKYKKRSTNFYKEIYNCIICKLSHKPLKKVDNNWFHIQCLYFMNLGKFF